MFGDLKSRTRAKMFVKYRIGIETIETRKLELKLEWTSIGSTEKYLHLAIQTSRAVPIDFDFKELTSNNMFFTYREHRAKKREDVT